MNSSRSLSGAPKVLGRNMDTGSPIIAGHAVGSRRPSHAISRRAVTVQLFDFQWLARPAARPLFLLFTQTIRLVQAAAKRN